MTQEKSISDVVKATPPDEPIDDALAALLMSYVNQIDARVEATDPNADLWHAALKGGRFGSALQIIIDYYRKYDPKSPDQKKITPGYIRHAAIERKQYQERKNLPPKPRQGIPMPDHIKNRIRQSLHRP